MKSALRLAGVLFLGLVASRVTAHAQVPYNKGAVTRVMPLSTIPGHSDALLRRLKEIHQSAVGNGKERRADPQLRPLSQPNVVRLQ